MNSEIINFLVKPGSSVNNIDGLHGDYIKVRVASPPQKGEANKDLVRLISDKLKIPKSNIAIVSGKKSRYKKISIKYPSTVNIKRKLLSN
ncbi:MAG: DUF167 domain-containing protein [Actinomycetota bacterium]